jgi:hypothetical protein
LFFEDRLMHRMFSLVGVALWLLVGAVAGAEPQFQSSLFDGQSLDGWRVSNCEAGVENGALVLKSGNGLVRSELRYRDFVLELEWRARKDTAWDSGIYFRCEEPPQGKPWPTRYQANLRQGMEGDVGGLKGATGGSKLARSGEWNQFRLTVQGTRAELEINGKQAWKADGLQAEEGYLGLQAEVPLGGQFEFRNIRVTEIGYRALFNGKDFSGWEGAGDDAAKCWVVADGQLQCTGKKGPWLRSAEQHGDFNLRFQYKLAAGGNSGVYVRVPKGGAHRGSETGEKEAGVEVQLLDDAAKQYVGLKPYQFCGSVYAIAPAQHRVSREAGRWNTLEIDCAGTRYRVVHNGVPIVDAEEKQFPELAKRLKSGYLGLQNHSTPVWFRDLRIGPPRK